MGLGNSDKHFAIDLWGKEENGFPVCRKSPSIPYSLIPNPCFS